MTLLWSQVVVEQLVGIDIHDDRPHVRPERRDRDRAGNVFLHQRPDDVLRQVAHRPQRGLRALEHEVADRNAAGVHAHDHRRQRSLGHPRHRPVRHRHHLCHRLAHVRAVEERELAQGHLLDVPRVDILNAVHVLEIQLELVDDEALHLVGAHPDIVEEDVDLRARSARGRCPPASGCRPERRRLIRATTSIKVVIGRFMAKTVGFITLPTCPKLRRTRTTVRASSAREFEGWPWLA